LGKNEKVQSWHDFVKSKLINNFTDKWLLLHLKQENNIGHIVALILKFAEIP